MKCRCYVAADAAPVCRDRHVAGNGKSRSEADPTLIITEGSCWIVDRLNKAYFSFCGPVAVDQFHVMLVC